MNLTCRVIRFISPVATNNLSTSSIDKYLSFSLWSFVFLFSTELIHSTNSFTITIVLIFLNNTTIAFCRSFL